MSIHHLDTFRYWLGDPARVLASTRPDPRTTFSTCRRDQSVHPRVRRAGPGRRAGTTSGRGRREKGPGPRSRYDGGSRGPRAWRWARSAGPAGRRACPARSTIRRSATTGTWHRPAMAARPGSPTRSPAPWAACSAPWKRASEPDISGRDNLKTIALCEAVLAAGREHAYASLMNSPDRPALNLYRHPRSPLWLARPPGWHAATPRSLLLLGGGPSRRWRPWPGGGPGGGGLRHSPASSAAPGRRPPNAVGPSEPCARPRSSTTRWWRRSRR